MLKKAILAGATTLAIAAGAMGATAGSASAAGVTVVVHNGPNWHHRQQRVCKPVFKNVRVWHHGHREWAKVRVGQKCFWRHW